MRLTFLDNKIDKLEVIMKQNNASVAVISECWDVTSESVRIIGYKILVGTTAWIFVDAEQDSNVGSTVKAVKRSNWLRQWDSMDRMQTKKIMTKILIFDSRFGLLPWECQKQERTYWAHTVLRRQNVQKYAFPPFVITGDFNQTKKQWVSSVLDLRQSCQNTDPLEWQDTWLDINEYYRLLWCTAVLGPLQNRVIS